MLPFSSFVGTIPSRKRRRTRLFLQPVGLVGAIIVATFLACALWGEWLAPYSFTAQDLNAVLQPPSHRHLFGTDQLGRDVLSRVIVGSRGIILLSFSVTALGLLLGVSVGLVAGYCGGFVDEGLMRLMDMMLAFPALLLALLVISILGAEWVNLVACMALIFVSTSARVVPSAVLQVKTREFIEAAHVVGVPTGRLLWRHILPNVSGPIIVEGSLTIGYAILLGAALGFLGLGVQPPSPDWGSQVNEGRNFLLSAPWMALFPALAISTLVVGVNLLSGWFEQSIILVGLKFSEERNASTDSR